MEHRVTAFFWGLCLLASGWLICASKASVSENLDKSISELKKYYVKKDGEIYDGHPIFLQLLKNLKLKSEETEQKLLMGIVLETYSRIFARMQKENQIKDVREPLEHVQEHLKKLQENYFPGMSSELKTYAETLWAIKENDPMVQRKALHELKTVYRKATELKNMSNTERRRRQAKRSRRQKSKKS